MNSPLVNAILATLCGYLLIVLVLFARDWYREEFPTPRKAPPGNERIRHAAYQAQAERALDRFSRLPQAEQAAIRAGLKSGIVSVEGWLDQLDRSPCDILCLGEIHDEATRQFLSDAVFDRFRIDVLLLEGTPAEVRRVSAKMAAGRRYFPLLEADILNVLRAVRNRNPDIRIYGIEETDRQAKQNRTRGGSRDRSLARNFWNRFHPGMRNVILVGGLHCTSEPGWLFGRLQGEASPWLRQRMCSVRLMGKGQDGALDGFLYFLGEIGALAKAHSFVVQDLRSLHPRIREWFPKMNRRIFEPFDTLLVFGI